VYKNANDSKKSNPDKGIQPDNSTITSANPQAQVEEPAGALLSVKDRSKAKNVRPEDFKQTFCISVAIDFVGVW
jgi:hypothetical protein